MRVLALIFSVFALVLGTQTGMSHAFSHAFDVETGPIGSQTHADR